ncbi:DUF2808 domain-containing protein [Phormidium sp. FACHB-592]|uniref:DUF2808 domain-containing protein n=1 Tax=Stenomitos frigidus AS-A4 TaxID=2933935 RepID=A0ABV0KIE6_9CYAN|nr:DUF2808 domain-containing protein [Phormidium sp. FACHB-592]MBD2075718.1 DUF2808 domain-containing protein [Phormidium sp. FACHB-592]
MQRANSVLMLVAINVLLNAWTALAKPGNPVISFDRSRLTNEFVVSDRPIDSNTYALTMTLPKRVGKQFAKVSISFTEQNRDKTIAPLQFDLPNIKAFAGAANKGRRAIAIQRTWIDETGSLWVQFKTPIPPQTKLTLALKLRQLPAAASYDYGIAAYPEPKAAASFVGDGTLTLKR